MNNFVMKHMKGISGEGFAGYVSGYGSEGLFGGGSAGETLNSLREELKKEKELTNSQNLIILKIINMLSSLGDINEEVNTVLISRVFIKYVDKFTAGEGDDFDIQCLLDEQYQNHVQRRLDRI